MKTLAAFKEIWVVDFEFIARNGERPDPVCLVAYEIRTGRTYRLWREKIPPQPPYTIDGDALFVGFYISAELGCYHALGWPIPRYALDLYTEYRNFTNGRPRPGGNGLLGAALAFGLDTMSADEKDVMRDTVLTGGPWSDDQQTAILQYCEQDVRLTAQLFERMAPRIDVERALLRGQFMASIASMEHHGVPIDQVELVRLQAAWPHLKDRLIGAIDQPYGIYDGTTFKRDRFEALLVRLGIPWPRLVESGDLDLTDQTFREQSRAYPAIAPIRELRYTLSQLRLSDLAVGSDHRNRCLLSPFRTKTSRCAPSNAKYIFGPSAWLRSLIRPEPGRALAYVDYAQQEFGTAGRLSRDLRMQEAYSSGDAYLTFAIQAGAAPPGATKQTHGAVRELYKLCALGVQYGMREKTLASRIGRPECVARELLQSHRATYTKFWNWSEGAVNLAMLHGHLYTTFGWRLQVASDTSDRTLRNFPVQANACEMFRLACILATQRGVRIVAPVHDGALIESSEADIDQAVAETRTAMRTASTIVLDGFPLNVDVKVIRYPDRYVDPRGTTMWKTIQGIVRDLSAEGVLDAGFQSGTTSPSRRRTPGTSVSISAAVVAAPTSREVHSSPTVSLGTRGRASTRSSANRGDRARVSRRYPRTVPGSHFVQRRTPGFQDQSSDVSSRVNDIGAGEVGHRDTSSRVQGPDRDCDLAVRPLLKWAGGKGWLLPHLQPIWSAHVHRRLVEPFIGAGAISLGLTPSRVLANDANPHLVNFLRWVQRGLQIDIKMAYDKRLYYQHRERFNALIGKGEAETAEAASLLFYLNRTCFNGLTRFNAGGFFNVPFGKYTTVNYQRDFSLYAEKFSTWTFSCLDFEKVSCGPSDFVYCDPPFDDGFVGYTAGGFSWRDQTRLAEWLAVHPGPVVASNRATNRIVELYTRLGFTIQTLPGPRRIACTGDRAPVMEVLASRNLG